MDNRRHIRMEDLSCTVDVSDGRGFFSGYVNNLSRFGLCLYDLPTKINQDARKLSLVISSRNKHFKMQARIRWAEEQGRTKKLGLELLNVPWAWTEFVQKKEPPPVDPWGQLDM